MHPKLIIQISVAFKSIDSIKTHTNSCAGNKLVSRLKSCFIGFLIELSSTNDWATLCSNDVTASFSFSYKKKDKDLSVWKRTTPKSITQLKLSLIQKTFVFRNLLSLFVNSLCNLSYSKYIFFRFLQMPITLVTVLECSNWQYP